jgi:hypothetical protein
MNVYPAVVKVVASQDFTLAITFDNGEEAVLDMKPHLDFGVFREIADDENFRKVRVSYDTVEWDCGIDLDPEFVYRQCKTKSPA